MSCTLLLPLLLSPSAPSTPSGDWPLFRGNAAQTGIASGELADELEVQWTFEAQGAIVSSPVIAGGKVYFGSDDQFLRCVDLETGELDWAFETDDIIEAPPMVHGDVVFCGSSDFFFYAVDAKTGEEKWSYETDDKVLGGAAVVPGPEGKEHVVFGSYDTHLYCLDVADGSLVWRYQTANYVNGTPAVWSGRAVFGGCDAILHVVDLKDGTAMQQVELGQDCHVAGSVAIADGVAYFGHYGNAFVAVDLDTSEALWAHRHRTQPFFSAPAITEDRVVFGGRDKRVHCVDRKTGEEQWNFPTRRKVDASPVICGDKVVVGSGDGNVYVLSLESGELIWSFEVGRSVFSSPAVAEGRVVFGANDKRLYCLGPKK